MRIFIVESEFQFRLAKANEAKLDKIVNLTGKQIFVKIFFTIFLIRYRSPKTKFISADHRSIATLILVMINAFCRINIFVMEDGFHTLLVDECGAKHLFWNCSHIKKFIMGFFKKEILNLKRYRAIGKYCNQIIQEQKASRSYVFFVDQPGLTSHNDIISVEQISKKLKRPCVLLSHPRAKVIHSQSILSLKNNDEALGYVDSIFYGYCSTLLLLAVLLGHDVNLILLKAKDVTSEEVRLYMTDIQNLLLKRFPGKIKGVMI